MKLLGKENTSKGREIFIWHVGEKRASTRGREREVIFREGEIRFILLVHRKRSRRFSTENKEQAVLSSTDRTAAFNSEIHHLARFPRCVLAGCGRTVPRNRGGCLWHEFLEFAEEGGPYNSIYCWYNFSCLLHISQCIFSV